MFANCQVSGLDLAAGDVCMTPPLPVPIPYVNSALGAMAIPNAPHILIAGGPAHNIATITPTSFGDEGGCLGGVASGTFKGYSRNTTGALTVLFGGFPVTRLTSLTSQNSGNICGTRVQPSQLIVAVLAA